MSDELDWELGELFDSGLFPFPVYELSAARRVVRYLMKRGVSDEELASAIQGSTLDLHAWLNRSRGRRMFGEWAIAWLNESNESHRSSSSSSGRSLPRRPVARGYDGGSLNDSDSTMSRDSSPSDDADSSDSSSDSDSNSDFLWSKEETEVDLLSSSVSGFSGSDDRDFLPPSARRLRGGGGGDDVMMTTSESFTSVRSFDVTRTALGPCLRHVVIEGNLTDSGNISDLSSAKSKNSKTTDDVTAAADGDDVDRDVTRDSRRRDVGQAHDAAAGDAGNCGCRLTHYIRCHDSRHSSNCASENHL